MAELEEEVGRSPDHTAKKAAHTYHPFVILCPWRASRVVHNPPRVVDIVVSRPQSPQTDWELPTVETLHAAHKLSTVLLESPYTQFLSGSPDDYASIHKSRLKSGWVEGSSPYLSLNRLLYVSWKLKKKSSYSIQENNNLQNKWLNEHTTKCWAQLSTNCCTSLWRLHFACASPQTVLLGSTHMQET
jgi:hypothetical protein